jgi:hypothetical protein
MIKTILLPVSILFQSLLIHAQNVGIGTSTPDQSAALDMSATGKGLLIPRMTLVVDTLEQQNKLLQQLLSNKK